MDKLTKVFERITHIAALICGYLILVGAVLIGIDVVARKLMDTSILAGAASELCGYFLALVVVWGAALTLIDRAHLRIDVLCNQLPPKAVAWMDTIAVAAFTFAAGFLTYVTYIVLSKSIRLGTLSLSPLAIPQSIPQFLFVAGLFFLTTVSFFWLARCLVHLFAGQHKLVRRIAGTKSAEEEVEEQTEIIRQSQREEGRHHV